MIILGFIIFTLFAFKCGYEAGKCSGYNSGWYDAKTEKRKGGEK